jgi:hypothetical protein
MHRADPLHTAFVHLRQTSASLSRFSALLIAFSLFCTSSRFGFFLSMGLV